MSYSITFADLQEQHTAVVRGNATVSELPEHLGAAFAEAAAAAQAQGVSLTGPPFGRYRPESAGRFRVEAGFPVSAPVAPSGRVGPATLPGGRVAHTLHVGAYSAVAAAYEAAEEYLLTQGCEPTETPWECYLDEPDVAAPRTEVFVPCRPVAPSARPQASAGRSL
jgi:effector-binding domain-containing protein